MSREQAACRLDDYERRHMPRINRGDFTPALMVDAGIDVPSTTPTLEEQMHDGPVPVRHVPDDDAQGDLLEQRERPMRFDQW